ncbi:PREDICTED: uncharacterized protein LOC103602330 [Galeopterus variegatus]|uniref:Uncharacterized protein LOC103602330 n=1 Tax=Galeopterus variegatus TaxID=482537 RepID=A0ABM0RWH1_GALVR|nr:PREDICTED: uncharacterized protein LOC103602330 [Galeopterus variegatus]
MDLNNTPSGTLQKETGQATREQLTKEIGVPKSKIQIWFKNCRLKQKELESGCSLGKDQTQGHDQFQSWTQEYFSKEATWKLYKEAEEWNEDSYRKLQDLTKQRPVRKEWGRSPCSAGEVFTLRDHQMAKAARSPARKRRPGLEAKGQAQGPFSSPTEWGKLGRASSYKSDCVNPTASTRAYRRSFGGFLKRRRRWRLPTLPPGQPPYVPAIPSFCAEEEKSWNHGERTRAGECWWWDEGPAANSPRSGKGFQGIRFVYFIMHFLFGGKNGEENPGEPAGPQASVCAQCGERRLHPRKRGDPTGEWTALSKRFEQARSETRSWSSSPKVTGDAGRTQTPEGWRGWETGQSRYKLLLVALIGRTGGGGPG